MKDQKNNFGFTFSNVFDEDAEMFPLMSNEDEEKIDKEETPTILPILPLRNTVLFPGVIIPITIGRDLSIKLINETYKADKTIGVLSQKDGSIETPDVKDLNIFGTVAHILKVLKKQISSALKNKYNFKILLLLSKVEKDLNYLR